jgi:excisionase family DNA binding protein
MDALWTRLIEAVGRPSQQLATPQGKARGLAEGLEALARALDTMAVELPHAGSPGTKVRERLAGEGELWTTAEVARYLKTSRSWVYQATASGRLPSVRVGHRNSLAHVSA